MKKKRAVLPGKQRHVVLAFFTRQARAAAGRRVVPTSLEGNGVMCKVCDSKVMEPLKSLLIEVHNSFRHSQKREKVSLCVYAVIFFLCMQTLGQTGEQGLIIVKKRKVCYYKMGSRKRKSPMNSSKLWPPVSAVNHTTGGCHRFWQMEC